MRIQFAILPCLCPSCEVAVIHFNRVAAGEFRLRLTRIGYGTQRVRATMKPS